MKSQSQPGLSGADLQDQGATVLSTQIMDATGGLEPKMVAEELGPSQSRQLPRKRRPVWRRTFSLVVLIVGLASGALLTAHVVSVNKAQAALQANQSAKSSLIKSQSIPLAHLGISAFGSLSQASSTLTVNGNVNIAGSIVLNPSPAPTGGAVVGQLYYNQQHNQLGYYNGSNFVYLQGGTTGGSVSNVNNVYNVNNVSNVTNISNFTNAVTGPPGVIPMFNGTGLSDSIMNGIGSGVAVGVTANTSTRFTVSGATSDSTTNALTVTNAKGTTLGQFTDSGQVTLGVSPGTAFGNDFIEPNQDTGINGIITADKFTTTGAEVVTSMSIYIGGINSYPYDQYQFGIYTDNSGAPGSWVASSSVGTLSANSWNTLPVNVTLTANTSYWLAYTTTSNTSRGDDPYYALTGSASHAYAKFSFGTGSETGMPAAFPAATVNDYTHSFYATTTGSNPAVMINSAGAFTDNGPAVFHGTNNLTTAFQVQNNAGLAVLNVDTIDNNVGIGTNSPAAARLSVVGATSDSTSNALSVTDSSGDSLAKIADNGAVSLGESRPAFGNTSTGNYTGSGYYNGSQQLLQAQSFTTTSGGVISSMSTYIGQSISGTNNLYQMALYSDVGNAPNTYIASTAVGTLTNSGWNTLPIAATLTANTTYWLVYWTNTNSGSYNGQNFISGYAGPNTFFQSYATWQSGASNGLPTTFPTGSGPSGGYETSIYATYATPISAVTLDSSGNITSNDSLAIQNSSSSALVVNDATGGTALVVDASTHQVGINTTVSNMASFSLVVQGTTALGGVDSTEALQLVNASGQALLQADTSNLILTVSGTTTTFATLALDNAHVSSTQATAPTYATPINCGTTPTAAVTTGSTDSAGSFTITTGSGTPTTCDTTITFNQVYTSVPKSVILTPATSIGGATTSTEARVSGAATTGFTAQLVSPSASTSYSYYYWVVQ